MTTLPKANAEVNPEAEVNVEANVEANPEANIVTQDEYNTIRRALVGAITRIGVILGIRVSSIIVKIQRAPGRRSVTTIEIGKMSRGGSFKSVYNTYTATIPLNVVTTFSTILDRYRVIHPRQWTLFIRYNCVHDVFTVNTSCNMGISTVVQVVRGGGVQIVNNLGGQQ